MNNQPKISVIMTTYNHEKYINEAIDSVLHQTFSNFELIIINDGSIDQTGTLIKQYQDTRLIYIEQHNQGVSTAFNNGVKAAKSDLIAFMSGDDVCCPNRLEVQYAYFLNKPETVIIFTQVNIIDESGNIVPEHPYKNLFNTFTERPRTQIFHRFFFKGNFLNAPSVMLRKKVFSDLGMLQVASVQLQDYFLWFKMIKKFDFDFIEEPLIQYRVRDKGANLSSEKNSTRSFFEFQAILEFILDDCDLQFFKDAFQQEIINKTFTHALDFELEKAFLFLKHDEFIIRRIGLTRLFYFLQDPVYLERAMTQYHYTLKDFYKQSAELYLRHEPHFDALRAENAKLMLKNAKLKNYLGFHFKIIKVLKKLNLFSKKPYRN